MPITVVVLPCVTCDLPLQMVHSKPEWTHLTDLPLADHEFGCPGWIDVFLGIEVFTRVLCNGQWQGPPGFPTTFNTNFGRVPAAETIYPTPFSSPRSITTHHAAIVIGYEILQHFWELEQRPSEQSTLSAKEHCFIEHFKNATLS